MQTITPFLWFNDNAEEATNFYVSVFKNSKVLSVNRFGEKVMGTSFEINGQKIHTLNGGPHYKLTPAISLFVSVETQQEVDELWEKLIADGGAPSRCGWLQDKFGLSWQIIPTALGKLMGDKDPVKAKRVVDAMMQMTKIDIAGLQKAYNQQ